MTSSTRSPWIQIALYGLGVSCLLTQLGCGAVIVPLSPPTATATSMLPQTPGSLGLDLGVSPTLMLGMGADFSPSSFTGLLPLSVRYGLPNGMDVSGTWGTFPIVGRLGGVQVGKTFLQNDPWSVGLTLGLAAYHQSGSYETTEAVLDEEGNEVQDSSGATVYEEVTHSYAVLGLAPTVGARARYQLKEKVQVVGGLRLGYSRTFNLVGDEYTASNWSLDPEVGVVYSPLKGLELGLGLSLSWPMLSNYSAFGFGLLPTFSASYSFPLGGAGKH